MQEPNKKAVPISLHRCVFYLSSLSLISQWILRTRTFISSHIVMVVIVLGAPSGKPGDWGWDLNRVLVLRCEQRTNNSYRMLHFESFVFTCLTYRNVQRFRNSQSMNFVAWKLIKWAKFVLVLTNTHMLKNQESSGTEFQRYGSPQLSRQKN